MSNIDWDKPLEVINDVCDVAYQVRDYARGADGHPLLDGDGDYMVVDQEGNARFTRDGSLRNVPDAAPAFDHWVVVYSDGSVGALTFDTFLAVQRIVERSSPEVYKDAVAVRLRRREDAPATVEIVEQAAL